MTLWHGWRVKMKYANFKIKQIGGWFDRKFVLYDGDIPISTSLNASWEEMDRLLELAKQLEQIKGDEDVQDKR